MARKEMAEELRELRKSTAQKSVSKMKLFEISAEIERLKNIRATTPAVASYSGSKNTTNIASSVDDVKDAKEKGFPTKPEGSGKKVKESKGVVSAKSKPDTKPEKASKKMTTKMAEEKPVKKMAKKSKKVVEEVSSDEE